MTPEQRDQIKRDAEEAQACHRLVTEPGYEANDWKVVALALAQDLGTLGAETDALLTALEQAEQERDSNYWKREYAAIVEKYDAELKRSLEAEHRLAKTPALVETLQWLREYFVGHDLERTDGKTSPAIARIDEVLAEWEAE